MPQFTCFSPTFYLSSNIPTMTENVKNEKYGKNEKDKKKDLTVMDGMRCVDEKKEPKHSFQHSIWKCPDAHAQYTHNLGLTMDGW